jgi:hypothetical protein
MASIDITTQSGAVGNGDLQLQNGAPMDATLRFVTDALNTASPLKLSTSLVQTTSTLKITTNDNPYIDAEDGSGNNRFTVGRAPASQQVNVDFASNPTGSTTAVGAIRTYRDGTNLSEAMTFIEDGSIGVGTTAPVGILDLFKSAAATRLAIRGDAGQNRLISYRTGSLQRFGLYVNNTAESGSNAGSDFAIRAYSDAGTLLSTPLFIKRSTGNVGIGLITPATKLEVESSEVTISRFVSTNAANTGEIAITSAGGVGNNTRGRIVGGYDAGGSGFGGFLAFNTTTTQNINNEHVRITQAGNVGIGTTTPYGKLDVRGGNITRTTTDFVPVTSGSVISLTLGASTGNTFGSLIVGNNGDAIPGDLVLAQFGGNVGIGTTAPASTLDVNGVVRVASYIEGSTFPYSLTSGSGADATITTLRGGSTAGQACSVVVSGGGAATNPNSIVFNVASAERGRFTTNGLTFNGDTAAANALDDYEEGTWTMGVSFGGNAVGVSYSINTGTYTKIGRQVTVNGYLALTSKGSSTGNVKITGLPFTIANNTGNYCASTFWLADITFTNQFQGYGNVNETTIDMREITSLGTESSLIDTDFANNSRLMVNLTYFV